MVAGEEAYTGSKDSAVGHAMGVAALVGSVGPSQIKIVTPVLRSELRAE